MIENNFIKKLLLNVQKKNKTLLSSLLNQLADYPTNISEEELFLKYDRYKEPIASWGDLEENKNSAIVFEIYRERVLNWASSRGLEKNITFERTSPSLSIIGNIEYRIIISNLNLYVDNTTRTLDLNLAAGSDNLRLPAIEVTFKKNIFRSTTEGVNPSFNITLDKNTSLSLNRNIFLEVSPLITLTSQRDISVIIQDNELPKSSLCIISKKNENEQPKDENLTSIKVSNNKIEKLLIHTKSETYLTGKNIIDDLIIGQPKRVVYWGPYQKIKYKKENNKKHLRLILSMKSSSEEKGDTHQTTILNREIIKCDRATIQNEPIRHSYQDRIIYAFGEIISDYGISWIRPITALFIINTLTVLIVTFISSEPTKLNLETLDLFVELFNPVSYLPNIVEYDDSPKTLLRIIGLLQKLAYGVIAYETIKVFRRFGKKPN